MTNEISSKNGTTMKPEEIREQISDMDKIGWDLRETVGVIRAQEIKVDSQLVEDSLQVVTDIQDYQSTIDQIRARHTVLVDEIMDFNPPHDREHYAAKDTATLEEVLKLLDSQAPVSMPAAETDSSTGSGNVPDPKGRNLTKAYQDKANAILNKK